MHRPVSLLVSIAAVFAAGCARHPQPEVAVYAEGITGARGLTLDDDGTLFVGNPRQARMYAISPPLDGGPGTVMILAPQLQDPYGLELRAGHYLPASARHDSCEGRFDWSADQQWLDDAANPASALATPGAIEGMTIEGMTEERRVALEHPVDAVMAPDGALFVADDRAGVIYRISFRPR